MQPNQISALLERAERRRQEAWHIINNLRLMDRWSSLGEPVVVGSVGPGLVVAPDIDLDVYCNTFSIIDSFQVMAQIAQSENVIGVTFKNEKHNRDKWLYWEIHYEGDESVRWTIEIYYSGPGDPYLRWPQRFARAMQEHLTDEHRVAILSIKEALRQEGKSGPFDVYRAVLDGGVLSPATFQQWLETNKTQGIVPWVPGE